MNTNSPLSHTGKNKQLEDDKHGNPASTSTASQSEPTGFPDDFPHRSRKPSQTTSADLTNPTTPSPLLPIPMTIPETPPSPSGLMFHGSTARNTSTNRGRNSTGFSGRNFTEIQAATFNPNPNPNHQHQPPKRETRKCWICYDDDAEEEDLHDARPHRSNQRTQSKRKNQRWVKACRCSLIAHESCLLTWITTYQMTHPAPASISSPLLTPVKCPQCAAIYQIVQPASPLLSLLHRLKRPYSAGMSWSALGFVVLGVGVSASSYGLWASRCFLGPVRWHRWVSNTGHGRGLNFLKFFQLSLVGPILILSRTKQLDSVLPFLPISLILSTLPPLGLDGEFNNHHLVDQNLLRLEHVFPPEPGLTLCLIPWMRIGWRFVWSRLSGFILRREYLGMSYQYPLGLGLGLAQGQAAAGAEPNEEDQVGGENQEHADLERPDEEEPNGPEQPAAEVVLDYTSIRTVIRIGMEALILPGAASLVGSLLLLLSRNRPWLRTLLGLKITSSLFTTQRSPLDRQPSASPSLLSSLKNAVGKIVYKMTRLQLFSGPSEADVDWHPAKLPAMLSGFRLADYFDEDGADDPVWWRNTLAGALIVVLKDLLSLTEKVLKLRKLKYRRILDVDQQQAL